MRSTANAAGKTPFASSCPSRLRADQVFDALVQALAIPLDANGNLDPGRKQRRRRGPGRPGPKAQARLARRSQERQESGPDARLAAVDQEGPRRRRPRPPGWPRRSARKPAAAMRPGGLRLLFDRLFGVDPSVANEDVMGTIPQALFLMNGPIVNNRIRLAPERSWARS